MTSRPLRAVFLEPGPPNAHIFSLYALPRLGSVLLATLLRDRGWEAEVFVEEVSDIPFDRVLGADLVGISTITSTAPRGYAMAREIRVSGIPVVLGGPHVTFLPDEGLQHADLVVRGEGEEPILALARWVEEGGDLARVPGLSWRRGKIVVHNPLPEKLVNLDALPAPDLSLIHGFVQRGSFASRVIPIQTTRGCPCDCDFCSVTGMFGHGLRRRSPAMVVEEMARYRRWGSLAFLYDDNFTAHAGHAREICRGIVDAGLDMTWSTQVRLEAARDPDLLDLMHGAGCRTVFIGFESVNQTALDGSRKSQRATEMAGAAAAFGKAGIEVHGMFIYGLDADGPGDLEATLRFAMSAPITTAQFLILTPFPGTELLRHYCEEHRELIPDWSLYDGHHVVSAPRKLSPLELQSRQIRSHGRFYSWPRSLWNLARGKVGTTAIYLYARRVNARWKRQNRPFLKALGSVAEGRLPRWDHDGKGRFSEVREAVKRARESLPFGGRDSAGKSSFQGPGSGL